MKLMNSAAVLALILGGALASSANAADLRGGSAKDDNGPGYLDDDVRTASWTGLWIGLAGGYNFFNTELDYTHDQIVGDARINKERGNINGLGAEGLFGEVQVGYDHQISNNLVLGVFGGLNLSDAEFEASYSNTYGDGNSIGVTTDYEYGGVIGPRLGFVRGNSMFYVAGGWAFAKLGDTDFSAVEKGVPVTDIESLEGPDLSGFFGEIGLEHRVAKGVRLGVAGRYTDYGKETLTTWDAEFNCPKEIEVDVDNLSAMVTLKIELGGRD